MLNHFADADTGKVLETSIKKTFSLPSQVKRKASLLSDQIVNLLS